MALLQEADAIVREEIAAAGLEREIWQAFAVLADIRSVGVMGDERTYGHPIIIRAVTSDDAMTADWARLPYDLLERMSNRIINEVPRHQPGRLRHHVEAARHDRVGVTPTRLMWPTRHLADLIRNAFVHVARYSPSARHEVRPRRLREPRVAGPLAVASCSPRRDRSSAPTRSPPIRSTTSATQVERI